MSGDGAKKKRGPESEYLDRLKGKDVGIIFVGLPPGTHNFLRCKLLWVDRYSYGIGIERKKAGAPDHGRNLPENREVEERMIQKHAVQQIFLVEGTGHERG